MRMMEDIVLEKMGDGRHCFGEGRIVTVGEV
jgi:hypothetical protein